MSKQKLRDWQAYRDDMAFVAIVGWVCAMLIVSVMLSALAWVYGTGWVALIMVVFWSAVVWAVVYLRGGEKR